VESLYFELVFTEFARQRLLNTYILVNFHFFWLVIVLTVLASYLQIEPLTTNKKTKI